MTARVGAFDRKLPGEYFHNLSLNVTILCIIFLKCPYKKYKFPVTILRLYLAYGPKQDENRFIPIVAINCLKNKSFELVTLTENISVNKKFNGIKPELNSERAFVSLNGLQIIIQHGQGHNSKRIKGFFL